LNALFRTRIPNITNELSALLGQVRLQSGYLFWPVAAVRAKDVQTRIRCHSLGNVMTAA
jgi:carbonic anhydrase/acetyltransferase-like protein (isoleucine patch superfamily)